MQDWRIQVIAVVGAVGPSSREIDGERPCQRWMWFIEEIRVRKKGKPWSIGAKLDDVELLSKAVASRQRLEERAEWLSFACRSLGASIPRQVSASRRPVA